uniref:Uncharacterized protein n=1 Tax=Anopheles atroparvus TaxID=41427 RepID=A0AAG5D3D2_ANOAO
SLCALLPFLVNIKVSIFYCVYCPRNKSAKSLENKRYGCRVGGYAKDFQ